jgi:toxin ParE1/3/4
VSVRYLLTAKADQDLDEQAYYLACEANAEVGHRFLVASHQTFALLASQPKIGWHAHLKHPRLTSLRVFRVSGFPRMLVLYVPLADGVEILRVIHGSRNLLALLRREGLA